MLLGRLPNMDADRAGQYRITEQGADRVSGRHVRIIAITPVDDLRYGYRIWIDAATALPLRTQLLSKGGEVIEQLLFTDIAVPARISDAELAPAVDAHNFRWVHQDTDLVDVRSLATSWQASTLPPGFRMTASARQLLPGGPVEHLVFSDGLASVSVFVPIVPDLRGQPVQDASTAIGFSSAYSTVVAGYHITAVGEVPAATVRAIAQSIRATAPLGGPVGAGFYGAPSVLGDTSRGASYPRYGGGAVADQGYAAFGGNAANSGSLATPTVDSAASQGSGPRHGRVHPP